MIVFLAAIYLVGNEHIDPSPLVKLPVAPSTAEFVGSMANVGMILPDTNLVNWGLSNRHRADIVNEGTLKITD